MLSLNLQTLATPPVYYTHVHTHMHERLRNAYTCDSQTWIMLHVTSSQCSLSLSPTLSVIPCPGPISNESKSGSLEEQRFSGFEG